MLPHAAGEHDTTRLFGTYNTVATLAGLARRADRARRLLAAVAARLPGRRRGRAARDRTAVAARSSSATSSRPSRCRRSIARAGSSRGSSALFALDSFGGGFVPQTFIAYLFVRKYGASPQTLAIVFFAIGLLQAVSFQGAVRLAGQDRAPAHDGLHPPALERPARRDRLRPEPRASRSRSCSRRFAALPGGRPHPPGVRRRRRRPERAHRRRRLHEHRPLPHPAGRAAARRRRAPRSGSARRS